MIRTLYHALLVAYYVFCTWYDQTKVHVPLPKVFEGIPRPFFGGRLLFLTIWNMLFQTVFFFICFINDIGSTDKVASGVKKIPRVRKIRDTLLASLGFPLAMLVGLLFWTIYFLNRELIFPKAIDQYFPFWLNHVMHTMPMLLIWIEMLSSYTNYPSRTLGFSILFVFLGAYLLLILCVYVSAGVWIYPVLKVLTWPEKGMMFGGAFLLSIGLYLTGEKVNEIYWKARYKRAKKGGTKDISSSTKVAEKTPLKYDKEKKMKIYKTNT